MGVRQEEAYTFARRVGDKACMARSLIPTTWFTDFWPEYKDQAFANITEALALSEEINDEDLIIDSKAAMVDILRMMGRSSKVVEQGEELADLLESRRDLVRLKEVYYQLMWVHLSLDSFERCVQCCDTGIRLAAELGVLPVQYPTIKAMALTNLGSYGAAWDSLYEEPADEEHQLNGMRDLGMSILLLDLMAYEKASIVLEDVIRQGKHLKRAWMVSWAQGLLAKSLIHAGSLDEEGFASLGGEPSTTVMAEFALLGAVKE